MLDDVWPEEVFVPKKNWHHRKKWKDMKRVRACIGRWADGTTYTGIPFQYERWGINPYTGKKEYHDHYFYVHFNRPSSCVYLRHRNGSVEFQGEGDAWGRPHTEGKSSRVHNRLTKSWWNEAYESLDE